MAIITACGSGKNRTLIHDICDCLKERGQVVLTPPLHNIGKYESIDEEGTLLLWKGATFAHLNRIKTADICIMVNPGGYLGVGSTLELGYAVALGKFVVALRHDDELARESLFDLVLENEDPMQIADIINELFK